MWGDDNLDGFVSLIKPPGMTAHDVVARVRRGLGGVRVGHTGTLDPDAAGLLVLAVGRARHLLAWSDLSPKQYWGRAVLGWCTDSLDAAGAVVARSHPPWPGYADWERSSRWLLGQGLTLPPAVSAKQVQGRRAYDAARHGERVWLPPIGVLVHDLTVESARDNAATFRATTAGGVYIRALVRDWGHVMGHAAHLAALIRTQVGPFRIEAAATLEEWEADRRGWDGRWQPGWSGPVLPVNEADRDRILRGQRPRGASWAGPTALVYEDTLLAVVDDRGFRHVFVEGGGWPGTREHGIH